MSVSHIQVICTHKLILSEKGRKKLLYYEIKCEKKEKMVTKTDMAYIDLSSYNGEVI